MGSGSPTQEKVKSISTISLTTLLMVVMALSLAWREIDLRPAWADIDEVWQLRYLQWWREGVALPLQIFQGAIQRLLLLASIWLGGASLPTVRINQLFLLLGESLLLFSVSKRLLNYHAALFTVMANVAAAFFFLRARSLLSFSTFPFFWLCLASWRLTDSQRWQHLLWGLSAGLFFLDYEAWPLGLISLLLLPRRNLRPFHKEAVLGLAISSLFLLSRSLDTMHSWIQIRTNQTFSTGTKIFSIIAHNFHALLWGADGFAYLNVSEHSFIPWWCLPGLLLGCVIAFKKYRWLLWSLGLGLIPLITYAAAFEMNRFIAAWIPLCLLTGLGYGTLLKKNTRLALPLALLAWGGAYNEWRTWDHSIQKNYPRFYGHAIQLEMARNYLNKNKQTYVIDSSLGSIDRAEVRFLLDPWINKNPSASSKHLVLLPWEQTRLNKLSKKTSLVFHQQPNEAPLILAIQKNPNKEITEANRILQTFWKQTSLASVQKQFIEADKQLHKNLVQKNPFLLNAFSELRMRSGLLSGQLTKTDIDKLLALNLPSQTLRLNLALHLEGPSPLAALTQFKKASQLDPRRRLAWTGQLRLLHRLGQAEAAEKLTNSLKMQNFPESYNPHWYWQ